MYHLVIKGTKLQAEQAATERGVSVTFISYYPQWDQTLAHTDADLSTLAEWYHEYDETMDKTTSTIVGRYPPGSLLVFSSTQIETTIYNKEG
jgi:hypothetical protein